MESMVVDVYKRQVLPWINGTSACRFLPEPLWRLALRVMGVSNSLISCGFCLRFDIAFPFLCFYKTGLQRNPSRTEKGRLLDSVEIIDHLLRKCNTLY